MSQVCMIVGSHQFPQYNGMIVEAVESDPLLVGDNQYKALYTTCPILYGERGPIYWFKEHLLPLEGLPEEEIEHAAPLYR